MAYGVCCLRRSINQCPDHAAICEELGERTGFFRWTFKNNHRGEIPQVGSVLQKVSYTCTVGLQAWLSIMSGLTNAKYYTLALVCSSVQHWPAYWDQFEVQCLAQGD